MAFIRLDLILLSATGLKDVNFLFKMGVYAVVSISSEPKWKLKTPVDKDSGTNQQWNLHMKFPIVESAVQQNLLTLKIKLMSERSLGDREIGAVHVPIKKLLENLGGEKSGKYASYSIQLPKGGTVNFAYKFEGKCAAPAPNNLHKVEEPVMAGLSYGYPPWGGYPLQPRYEYPPAAAALGYGYVPAYAYPQPQKPKRNGPVMALVLGSRLLGGLMIGDNVSDVAEMSFYDADGFDFFDFM